MSSVIRLPLPGTSMTGAPKRIQASCGCVLIAPLCCENDVPFLEDGVIVMEGACLAYCPQHGWRTLAPKGTSS